MTIELSGAELELIESALDVWERECQQSAMLAGVMETVMVPREARQETNKKVHKDLDDAEAEAKIRKRKSVFLRAKLMQASARESEHDLRELP